MNTEKNEISMPSDAYGQLSAVQKKRVLAFILSLQESEYNQPQSAFCHQAIQQIAD